jgi:hypothetical protein
MRHGARGRPDELDGALQRLPRCHHIVHQHRHRPGLERVAVHLQRLAGVAAVAHLLAGGGGYD